MTSTDRPWWRDAVVYQIYPRSFADANNDGTGDVRGMVERLDYLQSLGVNAVWVSPWYPSPMADGGYDVADYCDISPMFGTLDDADAFLAGAHERGIRALIDLVPNHCANTHPAFRAALSAGPGSPERSLFHFRDGSGPDGAEPPPTGARCSAARPGAGWSARTAPNSGTCTCSPRATGLELDPTCGRGVLRRRDPVLVRPGRGRSAGRRRRRPREGHGLPRHPDRPETRASARPPSTQATRGGTVPDWTPSSVLARHRRPATRRRGPGERGSSSASPT